MFNQGTNNAPSPQTIVPFFVFSAISWLIAVILILIHPKLVLNSVYFNEVMLTITHILVLGFITSVIFGALFQLLPVIFLRKIHSEKLARLIFYLLFIGTIGISFSFYSSVNVFGLILSGSLLNVAVALFIINIWKTIGKSRENKVAKLFIQTSAVWLGLTSVAGLLLTINFMFPYLPFSHLELLKVHAHFGIVGWFVFLIIGVSSVLIPMFLLVHSLDYKPLYFAYFFLLSSLVLGVVNKITDFSLLIYMAYGFACLGIVYYMNFIYVIYKMRPRKHLDYGLKKTMIAFPVLILVLISSILFVAGVRTDYNLSAFYLIALVVGFISTLILGQFYKTLPFIVWLKIYKPYVGKEQTLLPKDLYNYTVLKYQFFSHVSGFFLFFISLMLNLISLFYIGVGLLLIGAILFLINVMQIVLHKKQTL